MFTVCKMDVRTIARLQACGFLYCAPLQEQCERTGVVNSGVAEANQESRQFIIYAYTIKCKKIFALICFPKFLDKC